MPKSEKELRARDAKRDLGKELLQSVREMKAGRRGRVHKVKVSPIAAARSAIRTITRCLSADAP